MTGFGQEGELFFLICKKYMKKISEMNYLLIGNIYIFFKLGKYSKMAGHDINYLVISGVLLVNIIYFRWTCKICVLIYIFEKLLGHKDEKPNVSIKFIR